MNFKQTSIFYAPAFFFVLLGKAFASPEPLRRVIYLGITVITTFVVIWMPFCIWPQPMDGVGGSCIEGVAQLLRRIFPFQRGLYEDKVILPFSLLVEFVMLSVIYYVIFLLGFQHLVCCR